jgi:hypothetical protein
MKQINYDKLMSNNPYELDNMVNSFAALECIKNDIKLYTMEKELKLLCENIIDNNVSREVLKAYAFSYLNIMNKANKVNK